MTTMHQWVVAIFFYSVYFRALLQDVSLNHRHSIFLFQIIVKIINKNVPRVKCFIKKSNSNQWKNATLCTLSDFPWDFSFPFVQNNIQSQNLDETKNQIERRILKSEQDFIEWSNWKNKNQKQHQQVNIDLCVENG